MLQKGQAMSTVVEKSELAFETWWGNRPQSTPEEKMLKLHMKILFLEGSRVGYVLGFEQAQQTARECFGSPPEPPRASFLGRVFGGL
jgi:hypothetical protein